MDVDSEEKQKSEGHIAELERIEDNVEKLLRSVYSTMVLLSDLSPEKEKEIKASIGEYHRLLQSIESSLTKQINQCREPLLLPLLPIGHKNQYISKNDARDIHKNLFSQNVKEKQHRKGNQSKTVQGSSK